MFCFVVCGGVKVVWRTEHQIVTKSSTRRFTGSLAEKVPKRMQVLKKSTDHKKIWDQDFQLGQGFLKAKRTVRFRGEQVALEVEETCRGRLHHLDLDGGVSATHSVRTSKHQDESKKGRKKKWQKLHVCVFCQKNVSTESGGCREV